jgi:glyoxylase-like metal-dependent hydrolase (beta-lactamase superfamily II)
MSATVLRIGNVEITPLLDATAAGGTRSIFPNVTDDAWAPYEEHLAADPRYEGHRMPISISSFLVRDRGKNVLVDTGIGAKNRGYFPNGRLPEAMIEAGARPDEIDIVIATHIHVDHVGWHTTERDGVFEPTFPAATHIFHRAEFAYWTDPAVANSGGGAHVVDSVLPLRNAAAIELVEGEYQVTDGITLLPTPGHSPAHMSVAILSGGEAAVIIGDVCHHPAQVTEGWSPVFDMNPALAAQSREKLMQKIEDNRMTLIAGHFAHPGFGRIVRVEGKRYWRAL